MKLFNTYKCNRLFKNYPLAGKDEIENYYLRGCFYSISKLGYEKITNIFYPNIYVSANDHLKLCLQIYGWNLYNPFKNNLLLHEKYKFIAAFCAFNEGKKVRSLKDCGFKKNKLDEIYINSKTLLIDYLENPNKFRDLFNVFADEENFVIRKLKNYLDKEDRELDKIYRELEKLEKEQ